MLRSAQEIDSRINMDKRKALAAALADPSVAGPAAASEPATAPAATAPATSATVDEVFDWIVESDPEKKPLVADMEAALGKDVPGSAITQAWDKFQAD